MINLYSVRTVNDGEKSNDKQRDVNLNTDMKFLQQASHGSTQDKEVHQS